MSAAGAGVPETGVTGPKAAAGTEPVAQGPRPLLQVTGLHTVIDWPKRTLTAVQDVSLSVGPGEVVAVVGETGSGKSLTALSIMRLLRHPVRLAAGTIDLDGQRLTDLSARQMREIRGAQVGMIFQDPMTALNPFHTVGQQLAETITLRRPMPKKELRRLIVELLTEVGIVNPAMRIDQYPHELSGGTQQRVMIAMALANRPKLLIADEPTTGLDATVQAQILALIAKLAADREMGVLIITHDIGVVSAVSDRTVVMYAGEIVESGPTRTVLSRCRHPYTRALLEATPSLDAASGRLANIPGSPPDLFRMPAGCRFHPRCGQAQPKCQSEHPDLLMRGEGSQADEVRCWFPLSGGPATGAPASAAAASAQAAAAAAVGVALAAVGVERHFASGYGRRRRVTRAVDGVSIAVRFGETLGIVGESGCGKSTFAKILAALDQPTAGEVRRGADPRDAAASGQGGGRKGGRARFERGFVQFVFQDTFGSLDPRRTVLQTISEPLQNLTTLSAAERRQTVLDHLALCGLSSSALDRYPHELSGGQRQRVGICRALVVNPAVVVMDEPMSGLDVSVQAQIVNLLKDLRREQGLTSVLVSHDMGVIRQLADQIGVMYLGKLVEVGPAATVLDRPMHPYTAALISAAPAADPEVESRRQPILLRGEAGDVGAPAGCPFAPRCPAAQAVCTTREPVLTQAPSGSLAACHFPGVLAEAAALPVEQAGH